MKASGLVRICAICMAVFFLAACASAYRSYAVTVRTPIPDQPSLPRVDAAPVISSADYLVYRDVAARDKYYVLPLSLNVVRSTGNQAQSIALQPWSADHLILVVSAAADVSLLELAREELGRLAESVGSVQFYPAAAQSADLITDAADPQVLIASAVSAPTTPGHPFSILIVIQSTGRRNVALLRELLEGPGGTKLQAFTEILMQDAGLDFSRTVGVGISIADLSIGSLTRD
jgi:hypothetical protein